MTIHFDKRETENRNCTAVTHGPDHPFTAVAVLGSTLKADISNKEKTCVTYVQSHEQTVCGLLCKNDLLQGYIDITWYTCTDVYRRLKKMISSLLGESLSSGSEAMLKPWPCPAWKLSHAGPSAPLEEPCDVLVATWESEVRRPSRDSSSDRHCHSLYRNRCNTFECTVLSPRF